MRDKRSFLALLILGLVLVVGGCDDDGTNPNPNEPAAWFTVTPSTGSTQINFQFDASASTDEEDPSADLEVRWDWENDGVWDTDYTTVKTATHAYPAIGTYTVMLEVRDTGDLTDKVTHTVTVTPPNLPPTPAFAVTPSGGPIQTVFHVDASTSTDPEDSLAELQVRWDWEDDGVWDTEYSTLKTAEHSYTSESTWTIRLQVMDTEGLTNTVTHAITVAPCATPQLSEGFETPAEFGDFWRIVDGTASVEAGGFDTGSYWVHGHATGEHDAAILLKDPCTLFWTNYTLECDVKVQSNDSWNYAMIYFYVQSGDGWSYGCRDGYELVLKSYYDQIQLIRRRNGLAEAQVGLVDRTINQGTNYHVKVVVQNPTITVFLDGAQVMSVQDRAFTQGTIAFSGGTGGGGGTYIDTYYDNIVVTPTAP